MSLLAQLSLSVIPGFARGAGPSSPPEGAYRQDGSVPCAEAMAGRAAVRAAGGQVIRPIAARNGALGRRPAAARAVGVDFAADDPVVGRLPTTACGLLVGDRQQLVGLGTRIIPWRAGAADDASGGAGRPGLARRLAVEGLRRCGVIFAARGAEGPGRRGSRGALARAAFLEDLLAAMVEPDLVEVAARALANGERLGSAGDQGRWADP